MNGKQLFLVFYKKVDCNYQLTNILKSTIFNARVLLHKNSPLRGSSASVIFMALQALYDFNKTYVLSRMLH